MKAWVKEVIRSKGLAYLSIRINNTIRILPFNYAYRTGRLLGYFSILQAEEVQAISSYPTNAISISDGTYTVNMLGTIKIYDQDLDTDWAASHSIPSLSADPQTKSDLKQYEIIQLSKQIGVEFIPSRILATDGTEQFDYEMEIVS